MLERIIILKLIIEYIPEIVKDIPRKYNKCIELSSNTDDLRVLFYLVSISKEHGLERLVHFKDIELEETANGVVLSKKLNKNVETNSNDKSDGKVVYLDSISDLNLILRSLEGEGFIKLNGSNDFYSTFNRFSKGGRITTNIQLCSLKYKAIKQKNIMDSENFNNAIFKVLVPFYISVFMLTISETKTPYSFSNSLL